MVYLYGLLISYCNKKFLVCHLIKNEQLALFLSQYLLELLQKAFQCIIARKILFYSVEGNLKITSNEFIINFQRFFLSLVLRTQRAAYIRAAHTRRLEVCVCDGTAEH